METLAYKLQQFELGVVLLDGENKVQALNDFAIRILGSTSRGDPVGQDIYRVHPRRSREKIELLLQSAQKAAEQSSDSPPPLTMMINIPDKVLLVRVSKLLSRGRPIGTCMMFYDMTDITTTERPGEDQSGKPRLLLKLPVYSNDKILLLDLDDVMHIESTGHYTNVYTSDAQHFCNISLSDLEMRLNRNQFLRVHRSHMVNIRHAGAVKKDDGRYCLMLRDENSTAIPVGRSKVNELKETLGLT